MKRTMVLGSCLLFTAAMGCSPSTDDPDDDLQGDSISIETMDAEYSKVICKLDVCAGWSSPSTCESSSNAGALAEVKRQIAAGRVKFDGVAAKKCIDAMKEIDPAACWGPNGSYDTSAVNAHCEQMLQGVVAAGGDCFMDEECAAGVCHFGEDACPGKCVAFRTAGQSCDGDGEECADGLSCDGSKCVAPAGENESCEENSCADDLICNEEYTCVKPAAPGAAGAECDDYRPCGDGLFCSWEETRTCVALKPAGGDCLTGSQWGGGECQGRQVCAGSGSGMEGSLIGKCALPQDVGGPCVPANENDWYVISGCYESLLCDPETSKCVERPKAGQACIDYECAWDAYCNDENVCVAMKEAGEACEYDEECSSYFCLDGICADDSGENECVVP